MDYDSVELEGGNENRKYKVEAIWDSEVYIKELEWGYLPDLYYLVSWKEYPKEENTWEPVLTVQYLRKLISSFHNNYPDKRTATSPAIDTVPPMARPKVKLMESPK